MLTTRLEAIMFTDIAGYSQLMEADEERTIQLLRTHNEIVFPVIETHSGEIISSVGDGLLVVFPSASKAVECAIAVHASIATHNQSAQQPDRFKLRIGIHVGEVQHDGNQVYGLGVSVAARVQPFALPGGICITEDVYRQVERKMPNRAESIGLQELRNISRQYELYRLVTGYEDLSQGDHQASLEASSQAARPSGELDEIKERILSEIGKWSEKHNRSESGGKGGAEAGSKVFGIVEHIMDRAIEKWDTMPEEKRSDIIHKIKVGIEEGTEKKEEKASSSIVGEITWGAAATLGFGLWFAQAGSVWMIVVGTLIGVLPLISGIQKLIKRSAKRKRKHDIEPAELEGKLLKAAKELGGRVTVVQIAAHIGRPLEEVQSALDLMTARGYVSQEVLDSGVIRYDFPSLIADESDSKPIS
jgi:class 3 adenylate cyclase